MYKLCKTEQSAVRQRQLEKALLDAMRSTPYEELSISDLCERIHVPRKSFYRYFSGKDGALMALLDHTLMEFEQSGVSRSRKNTPAQDLQRYFDFWYDNRDLLDALCKNCLTGVLVERATEHALNEGMMPAYLRPLSQDVQNLALTFAVCGLLSMVIQWHNDGFRQSSKDMAQIATWLLTKPLMATTDK